MGTRCARVLSAGWLGGVWAWQLVIGISSLSPNLLLNVA